MQNRQARFLDLADQPLGQIAVAVDGPRTGFHLGQQRPADEGRQQHGGKDEHQAGRQREQKELDQPQPERLQRRNAAVVHQRAHRQVGHVQPVDQQEGGEHRHEEQHGDQHRADEEHRVFPRAARARDGRADGQRGGVEIATLARRRAVPHLARRHLLAAGQRRLAFQMPVFADARVALDHHVRADVGLRPNVDGAQMQQAAFNPRVLQVDDVADAGAFANAHQVRHADGDRAQVDLGPYLGALQAQPGRVQRRTVDHVGRHRLADAVGQPPAVIGQAPQRVAAGLQVAGNHAPRKQRNGKVEHDGDDEGQHRCEHGLADLVVGVARIEVVGEEGRQPLRHGQQHQKRNRQPLRDAAAPAAPGAVQHEWAISRGLGADHAGLQRLGDQAELAVLVDVGHRGLGKARVLAQCAGDARGKQRMAAQVAEKIQLAANRLAGEQFFERGKQHFFGRRLRRVAALGRRGRRQRLAFQHLAVDLAALQARHGGQRLEARRHHVGRQLFGEARAQGFDFGRRGAAGHVEGDELVDVAFLAQQHGGGADARLLRQHGLYLAQLNAKAADLHLVVGAAQALHLRAVFDPRQIACAVQPRFLFIARPGVGQELFGRQFGPAEVAGGHAGAGDAQLAGVAERQDLERGYHAVHDAVGVDHLDDQQAVVGQRLADCHRLAGLQLREGRRHRGLGRAVGVEHLAPGRGPFVDQRLRAHLAPQVDDAQARHVLREQRQQRGHGVQHRHVVFNQRTRQRLGVAGDLFWRNPQRGADEVADPDLLEAHVEGDAETLVDLVVLAHPQPRVFAAQEVADAALRDGDALGLAGGAAGVDHIRGVLRQRAFAAAQRGAFGQGAEQLAGRQDLSRNAALRLHSLRGKL